MHKGALEFSGKRFSPGLWPSLATFVLVPLFLGLGFWQLDRAGQKEELHDRYLERRNDAPLERLAANAEPEDVFWRRAILAGRFRESPVFLLDNQVLNRRPGYYVYGVFDTGIEPALLVNRGWVAASPVRSEVPALDVPGARVEISGFLRPPPATGWLLAENTDERLAEGLFRLQRIDAAGMEKKYDLRLRPYELRLDRHSDAGYLRQWREPASGREKHLGYAFQWFAMALVLFAIYVIVNLHPAGNEREKT